VELEGDHRRTSTGPAGKGKRRAAQVEVTQLRLFGQQSPLIDELKELDIDSLTPLEAITRLYELQRKAKEG
jgi:DNA mismatch repair protein MutS